MAKNTKLYLREHRQFRGLTQADVGKSLGIDLVTVSRWERSGKADGRRITVDRLEALAKLYGIEPQDFFCDPAKPSIDMMLRGHPVKLQTEAHKLLIAFFKKKLR